MTSLNKLNNMISLDKLYSLRSSVQKNTQHNLSKNILNGNEDMLDKFDIIEHTINSYFNKVIFLL